MTPYAPITTVFDEDLLAWSRRTGHWHARELNDHSRTCAIEARKAEQHLARLSRASTLIGDTQ